MSGYIDQKSSSRGEIRVLKIRRGVSWPSIDGYKRYNVCKQTRVGRQLSPMKLGPVYDESGELYARTIEDAWQCSKVWERQLGGGDDGHGRWHEWSRRGRFSGESRRHRGRGKPLYSYYMGEKLGYVAARKRMYAPWYARCVKQTDAYRQLKSEHLAGQNLLLVEYDGLDPSALADNRPLDGDMLRRLIDDENHVFGHGLVLATCLLDKEQEVWGV